MCVLHKVKLTAANSDRRNSERFFSCFSVSNRNKRHLRFVSQVMIMLATIQSRGMNIGLCRNTRSWKCANSLWAAEFGLQKRWGGFFFFFFCNILPDKFNQSQRTANITLAPARVAWNNSALHLPLLSFERWKLDTSTKTIPAYNNSCTEKCGKCASVWKKKDVH